LKGIWVVPAMASIIILSGVGFSQNAFSAVFIDLLDISPQDNNARDHAIK